jgi:hypothetical protein
MSTEKMRLGAILFIFLKNYVRIRESTETSLVERIAKAPV